MRKSLTKEALGRHTKEGRDLRREIVECCKDPVCISNYMPSSIVNDVDKEKIARVFDREGCQKATSALLDIVEKCGDGAITCLKEAYFNSGEEELCDLIDVRLKEISKTFGGHQNLPQKENGVTARRGKTPSVNSLDDSTDVKEVANGSLFVDECSKNPCQTKAEECSLQYRNRTVLFSDNVQERTAVDHRFSVEEEGSVDLTYCTSLGYGVFRDERFARDKQTSENTMDNSDKEERGYGAEISQ